MKRNNPTNATHPIREQTVMRRSAASIRLLVSLAILPGTPLLTEAQSLMGQRDQFIGNPHCSDWAGMSAGARFNWTNTFLSSLSMGLQKHRHEGQQKYKNGEGIHEVVAAIDKHCADNPRAQASDAAAPFLNP